MSTTTDVRTLFAGEWGESSSGDWLAVNDPADLRRVVARVPALAEADITRAYDAAEAGAAKWRATDPLSRGAVLIAAGHLLRERSAEIVADLVAEMGKTTAEATVEVTKAADFFEYYGGMARNPAGYGLFDGRPNTIAGVRYEPLGIVLAVTPWNDPLLTPARKLAPALYAGNAVVLKPATDTPLVSVHLAHALVDAGLPPEVLSVVTGRGRDISSALLADRRVRAVTFTGSNSVGNEILAALASRNLRIQTEMGGKNATAVLADADLDLAADTIVAAAFAQAGQRCTATSRLIVDSAVAEPLIERLVDRVGKLRIGPGADSGTLLGPVVNASQQKSVAGFVERAVSEGAQVIVGGGIPEDIALAHGCFVEPTIVRGVTRDMELWRDEVFGPVLAVVEVDGFDAAVEAVNDSVFGLSAAVFTKDLGSAYAFIDAVDTGQVSVNLPTSGWDVHHPFGGFRDSGSPFKEQGIEALHFYSKAKTYALRYA